MSINQSSNHVDILIGGDVCPTDSDYHLFQSDDSKKLFNDILYELHSANLTIANLECPLTGAKTPIPKRGPALKAPPSCINAFKNANIHLLNLANNHILDYGAIGLQNTLDVVSSTGLDTVGAGRNLAEARHVFVKYIQGYKIGVLALAEHEFSIATKSSAGANPLDLIDYTRNVASIKNTLDYLVVLFHGGNELYQYPSPRLKDTCHFFIEQGADAVICQHSHCIGCFEKYLGGHIVYGQGNFIFHPFHQVNKIWCEGILVRLSITAPHKADMTIVPFMQSWNAPGVHKLPDIQAQRLLQEFQIRSDKIQDDTFVSEQWHKFCGINKNHYLCTVLGLNRVLRRLNRQGHVVKLLYSTYALLGMENVVSCEAHREVLETILAGCDHKQEIKSGD